MSKLILRSKCQELLDNHGLSQYHVSANEAWGGSKMIIETECGKTLVTFDSIGFATKVIKAGEISCAMDLLEQFLLREKVHIKRMNTLKHQVTMLSADLAPHILVDYSFIANASSKDVGASINYLDKMTVNVAARLKEGKFTKPLFSVVAHDLTTLNVNTLKVSKTVTDRLIKILGIAKKLLIVKVELGIIQGLLSSCKI